MPNPSPTPPDSPAFTPWRPARRRAGGWSPDTQREFIRQLARLGSVGAAARACGKSARSAYQLRDKPGAAEFAGAWVTAMAAGQREARMNAIDRALHGELVPQFRFGRFMGYRVRYNDRLLVAAAFAQQREAENEGGIAPHLRTWQRQLEALQAALAYERCEMDARARSAEADAIAKAEDAQAAEARDDHRVWAQELAREKARRKRAEFRALARKALTRPEPVGPRIRVL